MNKTKKSTCAAMWHCLVGLVLDGLEWWKIRRMNITDVSLGISGDEVKVWAKVDGESVKIFDEKAGCSTLYLNTRASVYAARYPKENRENTH